MRAQIFYFTALILLPLSCMKEGRNYECDPHVTIESGDILLRQDECLDTLFIESNRSWTLSQDDNCSWLSTSIKEHVNLSGASEATPLVLHCQKNPIRENRSTSLMVISESGSYEIRITQYRAKPTVSYSFSEKTRYLDPEYFSSLGGKRWVNIKCNSKWTAEIDPVNTTAKGVSLETQAGEGDMENFTICVSEANLDFDSTKDIVICFHMEDDTDGSIVLKQQKGSILTFEFMGQDCNLKNWVFEGANPGDTNKGTGSFTTSSGGFVVGYSATTRCYLHSNGFQCGAGATDYIELPAIPGHKLIRVTDTDANGSTKVSICDENMNVVKGGEYRSEFKSYTPFTWNLTESQPDTRYRIVSGNTKTQRINTLELEYE